MNVLSVRRTSTVALGFSLLAVGAFVYSSGIHAQVIAPAPKAAVTVEEHRQSIHQHGGDRMWKRLDTDKDGQISKAELIASHQRQLEMFERADVDKNGKLSAEERKAFRANRHAS
jgi:EF hand